MLALVWFVLKSFCFVLVCVKINLLIHVTRFSISHGNDQLVLRH